MQKNYSIRNHFEKLCQALENTPDISEILALLKNAQKNDHAVFVIGNGGSAATATHFALDLCKNIDPPIRAMSFDNLAAMTAYANDDGYGHVFTKQLDTWAKPGDILFCISTSGQSKNVITAVSRAGYDRDMTVVALTGFSGGPLTESVFGDAIIKVPSPRIEIVEDAHSAICHSLVASMKYA